MRKKAFTLIEVMIAAGISVVIFSIIFYLIRFGARSMQLMAKSEFYSGLQYLSWYLRQEVQYGREILYPPVVNQGKPATSLLFYNQDSELQFVFRDPNGLLVLYNFEKKQFRDITNYVKSLRVLRTGYSTVRLELEFAQADENFRWQNEISLLNS
jgi:prepilin-type N-terminal cleavage/methylation domain-containing protein